MPIMPKMYFEVPITNIKIFVSQKVLLIEEKQFDTTIWHVYEACTQVFRKILQKLFLFFFKNIINTISSP